MSSLNSLFREAIIEHNYRYSMFDGKKHNIDELQICHILSKSKRTLNSIKKAYNCDDKIAEMLMNMPLLNTVVGTRKDNTEYKKTDNINFVDKKICKLVSSLLEKEIDIKHNLLNIPLFSAFYMYILLIGNSEPECSNFANVIKYYQSEFHKEIDLHF